MQRPSDRPLLEQVDFGSTIEFLNTAAARRAGRDPFPDTDFPADGTYTLRAYALDAAGNLSPAAVATFTINPAASVSVDSVAIPIDAATVASIIISRQRRPDMATVNITLTDEDRLALEQRRDRQRRGTRP